MSTKQTKTVTVVCVNPTSTFTKGKLYQAEEIKARTIVSYWENKRAKCYRIKDDNGKTKNILALRFQLK